MTSTEPRPDIFDPAVDDPTAEHELLAAARAGSAGAFGVLYARHRDAALATARSALPAAEASYAEDVVEVAFARVLGALRNGKGPTDTLRYYLATTVRREVWRSRRRRRRQAEAGERWTREDRVRRGDEITIDLDAEASLAGAAAAVGASGVLGGHELLGEAFRGLSDRWRHVLWLTEVEGRRPAEIAGMLGLTPGSAAALAYRARQGLLAAYADAYGAVASDPACRMLAGRLGRYLAAGEPAEGFDDVVVHLEGCASCRDVSRGIDVVGTTWRGLAPFGLLTAGLWAKGMGAGGGAAIAGAVGGIGAAGGATGAVGAGPAGSAGSAGGAGGAAGGFAAGGMVAGAAAAMAVVALAVGALAAARGDDSSARAAAPAVASVERDAGPLAGGVGPAEPAPGPSGAPTTAAPLGPVPGVPSAEVPEPAPAVAVSGPRLAPVPPAASPQPPGVTIPTTTTSTTMLTPTTTTTTTPSTTTTTTTPSTTTTTTPPSTTTTTTTPSTTTTTPPPVRAQVGGVVQVLGADGIAPVPGVTVTVLSGIFPVAEVVTGPDGSWRVGDLPAGTYWLLATVPAAYAPASGDDPWSGGPTWLALLGFHRLVGGELTPVDLPLSLR